MSLQGTESRMKEKKKKNNILQQAHTILQAYDFFTDKHGVVSHAVVNH
jgi:hypothetical protein